MGTYTPTLSVELPSSSLDRRSIEFIVSPKKVVGCRGGRRYVEGGSWLLGFLVSKFLCFRVSSFLVSWCQMVSKFLGFKVSKIYQMLISCFQEKIGPISKIFKILLDGSTGFVGARLFEYCQHLRFPKF